MIVLGIESTCDETAVAIVENGFKIISHVIFSQADIHSQYGGVVPELASRHHIEVIFPLIEEALRKAELSLQDIDLFAVAKGPGLIGSLLVGIQTAKALAWAENKPLVGVNHIEAHLFASIMLQERPEALMPALGVVLSGGHSSIFLINQIGSYKLLGQTIDDAIGEAFDKVGKMLGVPYPGGPWVEKLAQEGNDQTYSFKAGVIKDQPFNFSFSGLKTAVLYALSKEKTPLSEKTKKDIAASFQRAAFSSIQTKLQYACQEFHPKAIFFGGGVTQNMALRNHLQEKLATPIYWPSKEMCLDNAAMIAGLGYNVYQRSHQNEVYTLTPSTRIAIL